jgi:hypothetical protein
MDPIPWARADVQREYVRWWRQWGWEYRLDFLHDDRPYRKRVGWGGDTVETTLTRYGASGWEYQLPVVVEGHFVPAERGCTLTPDIPATWEDVEVRYFRPGRGWKWLELTEDELEWAQDVLKRQRERIWW